MAKRNVKRTFITNDSARKISFKKRKSSLIKKTNELSTLCGIEACAIIYSPFDPQPEVWPSHLGAQQVIAKFRRIPELEQSKKMVNQESFLKERIQKVQEQVKRQRNANKEKEMTLLMFQQLSRGDVIQHMSMTDLNYLAWLVDQKLKDIMQRKVKAHSQAQVSTMTTEGEAARNGEKAQVDQSQEPNMNIDAMQKQQWFINLINGGMDEMLPFGDVNLQNGVWPNTIFP